MLKIAIISASVREGRKSPNVAKYFYNYINENKLAEPEILDLKEFNFPLFDERLMYQKDPSEKAKMFSQKVTEADAVIIVFPEYNSGFPASLKNVIDLLVKEWYHKPVGLVSVSAGGFGGVNAMALLQSVLTKIKAVPVASFPVPKVEENFDENGTATDKEGTDKRAAAFMKEVIWFAEAFNKMKSA
ncbi:MAG: NAD(P)H-dependent oxidoreductase [Bacteroidetes bacterium]|nr:NAD(P)H-dependent oxidoreductase [Bacteroidota bacterium]